MINNKVYQSCNTNLVVFLQERDPPTLTELAKLGDQYYAAHPNSQVQKELQAFACETNSIMSDEKIDAYAAHTFQRPKPQHQGRSME